MPDADGKHTAPIGEMLAIVDAVILAGRVHNWGVIPHDDIEFTIGAAEPLIRRQVAEEIAASIEKKGERVSYAVFAAGYATAYKSAAKIAREIGERHA